jgi:GNAT superfamily N-acetyltransferase
VRLVVTDLPRADDEAARELLAHAFVDEPYVTLLHGDDPATRLDALRARYAAEPPGRHTLELAAYADGALVGVCLGSLPGTCLGCERNEDDDPWSLAVEQVHRDLPAHVRVGRLGVAPTMRGEGVGAGLLHASVARARGAGAITVLECQAHRIAYYERRGFEVVARVPDMTGADGAVLVRS